MTFCSNTKKMENFMKIYIVLLQCKKLTISVNRTLGTFIISGNIAYYVLQAIRTFQYENGFLKT